MKNKKTKPNEKYKTPIILLNTDQKYLLNNTKVLSKH